MPPLPPLALSLPIAGVDARDGIDLAQAAAHHGYQAVWASEVQGPDAVSTLGALAVATDLDLGVAVVPVQTRSAFVLGMTAVSLAELSGGRFTLGLGASSELIVGRWGQLPYDRPLTAVTDAVAAIRPILAGERADHAGEVIAIDGYRPHASPPGGRVPLVLGALNPRSCRTVGALGVDGVCLNQLAPHHVPLVLEQVAEGAGGALPPGFQVVARLFCAVTDDVPAAREHVKATFAPYLLATAYNRFYRWMGYETEAQAVLDAKGDKAAMAAALSDRLVDDLFCLGTAEEVAGKIAAYGDAGVTVPVIQPLAFGREQAEATLWPVAAAWAALADQTIA